MSLFGEPQKSPHRDIERYIRREGDSPEDWYVGVTENWIARLFSDHRVVDGKTLYIVRKCQNNEMARQVKAALLELMCDGEQVGQSNKSIFVYAYKKTIDTTP
jgi:hypothetical protein